MKTVTIYLDKRDQPKIKDKVSRILATYKSFVLAEADEDQIKALRRANHKLVVRDEIEAIRIGDAMVDTKASRYDRKGALQPHRSYGHLRDPGPEQHHYIVQFIGPIQEEWKKGIRAMGAIICDPLPSYAYVVEMNGRVRNQVIKLPYVRWVGHYDPAYRLAARVRDQIAEAQNRLATPDTAEKKTPQRMPLFRRQSKVLPFIYSVRFHTRENLEQAIEVIQRLGLIVEGRSKDGKSLTVQLSERFSPLDQDLDQLAATHGVRSITPLRIKQLHNDVATRIMTGRLDRPATDLPYTGKREIVAVADTGLDTGDANALHIDFSGRIAGIRSWPINPAYNAFIENPDGDDGPADLDSGHGTHVAGSILGDGAGAASLNLPPIRGLAHGAKLFFQAVEHKMEWASAQYRHYYGDYLLAGVPDDITRLFQQAYDAGARIHNNSWGGGDFGVYDEDAQAVDRFVWEHKDMIVLFAASNDGEDRDEDGAVNPMSLTPPGTAKNCITVGASENLRTSIDATYAQGWPDDFSAEPIASDRVADDISDIAAFSSRGPCIDGRLKPDVVAPGTFILSTRSSRAAKIGWGALNDAYMYMGGTSMATPLTAGAVALLREYLRTKRRRKPSAALVKAVLIHIARRRAYRHAAPHPSDSQWDYDQGWGHVDLSALLEPANDWRIRFKDITSGLHTGDRRTYRLNIGSSRLAFKVTLAWTDYPAGIDQYPSLMNNLNMIVTAPDGTDIHGNAFEPPHDRHLDNHNNVEMVVLEHPLPGRYKIRVVASDIREGPQHFGLVFSGHLL